MQNVYNDPLGGRGLSTILGGSFPELIRGRDDMVRHEAFQLDTEVLTNLDRRDLEPFISF